MAGDDSTPSVWRRIRSSAGDLFHWRSRMSRRISPERRQEVIAELEESAAISQDYLMLAMLSCVIATFGLVLNSGAVIIGAMLIAPLMSPILSLALALIRGDARKMLRALVTLLAGILIAIIVSALLGTAVSTSQFNFLAELPVEVTSRTSPTLFDLTIALAGGLAASYALAQPRLSPTLPGVAIATALMPPLCVVGIGISQGQADVRDGALLLFLANFVAIVFSSAVVFALVGFGPLSLRRRREVMSRTFLLASVMLVLVAIPLVNFMVGIAGDAQENQTIRATISSHLETLSPDASLVSFDKREIEGDLSIQATVRTPRDLLYAESLEMQEELASALNRTVALDILVIPITRLEPIEPPSETPNAPPDSTATATRTLAPTSTATTVPGPTATLTPGPTRTPVVTATRTLAPTSTALPPAPTAAPPTPTPVVYMAVGATDGEGVNVRRDPRQDAPRIIALQDGVVVQLTGQRVEAEGFTWIEVVVPDGRVGWIAEPFLVPFQGFTAP
ncbi:MAG: DUF389 domain-containing protein [Thermomicrobiales bacterium]